jgi:hypothetical protein
MKGVEGVEYTVTGRDDVLLPLGQHALSTLNNLGRVHVGSVVRVSPVCHEHPDQQREVRGWVLDVPAEASGEALPISFNMFDGLTVVECEMTEMQVFQIMQDQEGVRRRLGLAVSKLMKRSAGSDGQRATWARCKPCVYSGFPRSLEKASKDKDGRVVFARDEDSSGSTPILDSEEWVPELSPNGFVGLYHHWHRSPKESRMCLYVVCQSHLPKACLEFADLVHQVSNACTAGWVCLSEEAQWLRTACARNRRRVILDVCEEIGLRVPCMLDYNACNPRTRMAIAATESLHHDMVSHAQNRMVRVLNYCAETRRACNGIACAMAPWDGVWVFHGVRAHRDGSRRGDFGVAHGGEQLLPTCAPHVKDRSAYKHTALTFTAAEPLQCAAMRVWPDVEDRAPSQLVLVHHDESLVTSHERSGTLNTEGLDPEVVRAYEEIVLNRACPVSYTVPNMPGALPSDKAVNVLVFDEYVLNAMQERGWNRTQGVTQLTPMACALYEHWEADAAEREDI